MADRVYEKPEFKFKKLQLFEGVAETCWGYGHVTIRVYKDNNKDGDYDEGTDEVKWSKDFNVADSGHCNQVAGMISDALAGIPDEYKQYATAISGKENSKSRPDSPWQDFIVS